MSARIEVRVGRTIDAVEAHQCDDVIECDTIAEARRKARHCISEAYRVLVEASEPFGYAAVYVDGKLHSEFTSERERRRQAAGAEF